MSRIQNGLLSLAIFSFGMSPIIASATNGMFMIGLPDETVETISETIDFSVELDMKYFSEPFFSF